MLKRTIAGAVLVAVLAALIFWLPPVCMLIAVALMAAVASYEMLYRTGMEKNLRLNVYSAVMAMLVCLWSWLGCPFVPMLAGILVYHVLLFGEVLLSSGKKPVKDLVFCWLSGVIVPFLLSALLRLYLHPQGKLLILVPFVMAFLSDTGAYLVGVCIGKHKMCPNISPKKSWEGFFGGIAAAVLGMILYGVILEKACGLSVNFVYAAVYGLLGSLAGVFGDLSMSVIKRQTGIKDYGNLIPGHGGILDRFDSVLVTAPLAEVLLLLIPVV